MPKKRWTSDGPRQSAEGWGWDYRLLQSILYLSKMHGRNWAEVKELRIFFSKHPEFVPTKREWDMTPPDKMMARIKDAMVVFEQERQRRKAVYEGSTDAH